MASIGGLSSSTSSSLSSLRGYGGLASGLDRDSLIEGMTSGTQSKIQVQKQKKQKLLWQQEGLQSITDKLYQFQQKYMSYASSSTNMLSNSFFTKNTVTSIGENSKYVSVTGNSSMLGSVSVAGVKQLAQTKQYTTKGTVTSGDITSGDIKFTDDQDVEVSNIAGKSLYIKYGTQLHTVRLSEGSGYKYDTVENVNASIEKALKEVDLGNGKTLADALKIEYNETDKKFIFTEEDSAGNTISIAGGSGVEAFGLLKKGQEIGDIPDEQKTVTSSGLKSVKEVSISSQKTMAQALAGKEISFVYNGTVQWVTIPEEGINSLTDLQEHLQKTFDKSFGNGRITVDTTDLSTDGKAGKLVFKTTLPNGDSDPSSVLSISSASAGLLGDTGILGMATGESNRLNTNMTLVDYMHEGISPYDNTTNNEVSQLRFKVNGTEITGLTSDSTIQEIIDKINSSDAGVTVKYLSTANKFTLTATESGAGGKIEIKGIEKRDADGNIIKDTNGEPVYEEDSEFSANALWSLFGGDKTSSLTDGTDTNYFVEKEGQDAIIAIKYSDSSEPVEISRPSNSFDLDGLNFTVSGKFGYVEKKDDAGNPVLDENGKPKIDWEATEAVTFDSKVDVDSIYNTVKDMVEAYNEIIDLVNTTVNSKQNPNDKYDPLTDQQKQEMSEDEVKTWNEKAKVGVLFNDSDLRSLADALRFVIPGGADSTKLKEFGLSTSESYGDHGKLTLNETDFKAALAADPAAVQELFTREEKRDDKGDIVQEGGVIQQMNIIYKKYASMTGSTKGSLVERAGSPHAPTSVLKNGLQTEMDSIDKVLARLKTRLENEQDRYIKQFTSLETLISQMNSQSSYLSQLSGGY